MKKIHNVIYGIAFALILCVTLLADGLADLPHGFIILFAIVGVAGALVLIGNRLEYRKESRSDATRRTHVSRH